MDSQWAAQVRHYTVSRIEVHGQDGHMSALPTAAGDDVAQGLTALASTFPEHDQVFPG